MHRHYVRVAFQYLTSRRLVETAHPMRSSPSKLLGLWMFDLITLPQMPRGQACVRRLIKQSAAEIGAQQFPDCALRYDLSRLTPQPPGNVRWRSVRDPRRNVSAQSVNPTVKGLSANRRASVAGCRLPVSMYRQCVVTCSIPRLDRTVGPSGVCVKRGTLCRCRHCRPHFRTGGTGTAVVSAVLARPQSR